MQVEECEVNRDTLKQALTEHSDQEPRNVLSDDYKSWEKKHFEMAAKLVSSYTAPCSHDPHWTLDATPRSDSAVYLSAGADCRPGAAGRPRHHLSGITAEPRSRIAALTVS